jgi:hypothetical protein
MESINAIAEALARWGRPVISEQTPNSAVAELLEVAEILARLTHRQDLADRAEAAIERVRSAITTTARGN